MSQLWLQATKALEDAIDMVRKGVAVMMFGVPTKGAMMNIDMSKIYSKKSLWLQYETQTLIQKKPRMIESGE